MAIATGRQDGLRSLEGAGSAPETGGTLLPASRLYHRCEIADLAFATVDELPDAPGLLGQERAIEAVRFGIGIKRKGFNLYVLGPGGTGRHTLVEELLRDRAAAEPVPSDWCYVNNFAEPRRPRCLRLPAGRAVALRDAMAHLVEELKAALPAAFEREDYRARREVLEQQLKDQHETAFGDLARRAEEKHVGVVRTPVGIALAPTRNGEVIPAEEFGKLSEAEKERIRADVESLQPELEAIVRRIPEWERQHREAVRQLNRETTRAAVGLLLLELRIAYTDLPEVLTYLDAVEQDILENSRDFLRESRGAGEESPAMPESDEVAGPTKFRRYQVNVMIDHGASRGAPVIEEDLPTHQNLVGRVEHLARFGTLMTDFNLLKPGALHRANGGYLVLDVHKLLTSSFGWESLKRALKSGEIETETLEQFLSLASTVSLEPDPIPLEVKVILVGPPLLYYLLAEHDPEFPELFKVAADFEHSVDRTHETTMLYARLIASLVRREKIRPLDRAAVARTVEYASRLAEDSSKLSTELRPVSDLLQEADYIAATEGKEVLTLQHVEAALAARERRASRIAGQMQEAIRRRTLRIETEGERIGQVNGLSVVTLGDYSFGHPSRITAQVRLGAGEVIDIEREVELGGPLHSKGVLILTGFLGGRFARSGPLSLSASLVFEQSYGGVEGDSASSAELFALLSALAQAPVRQCFAVTGSVDQHGQIQPIGGVNEKIEGFFEVCRARGLDGSHGVIIPSANVPHLMLRKEVVEAAAQRLFQIHAIDTVDQGIEILTGIPAGIADIGGNWPEGSLNRRIAQRLASLASRRLRLERREPSGDGKNGHGR